MYGLFPPGKERHEALIDGYADDALAAGLAPHYEPFLALNDRFKELCTRWQVKNGEPNDHADAAYDASCVTELAALAAEAEPIISGFADALPRMSRYQTRLDTAAACVARGENNRFTGVMCESFHDIWMELHEDLIVLQRIDRAAEGSF